jgi:hypothetical protein
VSRKRRTVHPVSPPLVARVTRVTEACLDRGNAVRMPRRLRQLGEPLRAAQAALLRARRTEARLTARHLHGANAAALVAGTKARVQALLATNYAIERHDRTALRIALATAGNITSQLGSLAHAMHLSAC